MISIEDNEELTKEASLEEILDRVRNVSSKKALGPDEWEGCI